MSLTVLSRRGFAIGAKVIHLRPLDISTYTDDPTLRVVPALIFSPAPGEVSFVTEERTSIMTAFTGDAVYGTRIFTPDTFVRYVERQHREERRIAEERASADLMHR